MHTLGLGTASGSLAGGQGGDSWRGLEEWDPTLKLGQQTKDFCFPYEVG